MLRIVSANLWNGRASGAGFAALVEELRADIAAVQELHPGQACHLERVLPHGRLEPAVDYSGMGIALRAPGEVGRILLPCRDARRVECSMSDGNGGQVALEVINVHVQAPHSPFSWETLQNRRGQLRGLLEHIERTPQLPRVVVGDLNATPAWPLYRGLAKRLRDAALEAGQRSGLRPSRTWGPWPGSLRLLRIDHAFVAGVAVHAFRVVPIPGGDHSAIVVDVKAGC
jgi:endonuclease/exonuclease/phosphatase family metal-dependent hydrolase